MYSVATAADPANCLTYSWIYDNTNDIGLEPIQSEIPTDCVLYGSKNTGGEKVLEKQFNFFSMVNLQHLKRPKLPNLVGKDPGMLGYDMGGLGVC